MRLHTLYPFSNGGSPLLSMVPCSVDGARTPLVPWIVLGGVRKGSWRAANVPPTNAVTPRFSGQLPPACCMQDGAFPSGAQAGQSDREGGRGDESATRGVGTKRQWLPWTSPQRRYERCLSSNTHPRTLMVILETSTIGTGDVALTTVEAHVSWQLCAEG